MVNVEHLFRYKHSTALTGKNGNYQLQIATEQQNKQDSAYFQGTLAQPMETARCLRAISILVGSRYYVPPAMLAKILREADPVVTASRSMLRFEGFSACCSTYGRLDILEDGFSADKIVPGTTNIDFQAEMRASLSKVRSNSKLEMSFGADAFELVADEHPVVERKVKLPLRWIKGFSEVQAQQLDMSLMFNVSRGDAIRFFRELPRAKTRHPAWVVAAGKGVRLSHREVKKGVRVKGLERLRVLEDLVQLSDSLSIYKDSGDSLSAWVLSIGPQRFTLVLSAEPWRGFSGEGKLLTALATKNNEATLAKVKSSLVWQEAIAPDELASSLGESPQDVITALSICASSGLLGFDVFTGRYFHRVLPFDMSAIEGLSPRLKSARKLVDDNVVSLTVSGDEICAEITSSDVVHRVRISSEGDQCTCPWYAKHQSDRGPCKHVLATYIVAEESK